MKNRFWALRIIALGVGLGGAMAMPASAQWVCKQTVMSRFEPEAKRDVTVCATSALSTQRNYNFGPDQAVDSNPKTAWVEGERGNGLGNWIRISFQDVRPVRYLGIENGFGKQIDSNRWMQLGRVKDALIETSDGLLERVRLKDTDQTQYVDLGREIQPTWIRLTLLSVYPGTRWEDTALTEFWAMPSKFKPLSRDIVRRGVKPHETEPVSSP
jgi:hypothetical protein